MAGSLPSLVIGHDTQLTVLDFDRKRGEYRQRARCQLPPLLLDPEQQELPPLVRAPVPLRLTTVGDAIFVGHGQRLTRRNRNLHAEQEVNVAAVWPGERVPGASRSIAALTSAGEVLWLSACGQLIAATPDLSRLGNLPMLVPSRGAAAQRDEQVAKNADDIIIAGDRAYLLDDVMAPLFIFEVDVSQPAQPTVIERVEGRGINAHLTLQWVDTAAGYWTVSQWEEMRSGSFQTLITIPLHDRWHERPSGKLGLPGSPPPATGTMPPSQELRETRQQLIFARDRHPEDYERRPPEKVVLPRQDDGSFGTAVRAATPHSPVFALGTQGRRRVLLSVHYEPERIRLEPALPLGERPEHHKAPAQGLVASLLRRRSSFVSVRPAAAKAHELVARGRHLVATIDNTLWLIDTEPQPRVVCTQELPAPVQAVACLPPRD